MTAPPAPTRSGDLKEPAPLVRFDPYDQPRPILPVLPVVGLLAGIFIGRFVMGHHPAPEKRHESEHTLALKEQLWLAENDAVRWRLAYEAAVAADRAAR